MLDLLTMQILPSLPGSLLHDVFGLPVDKLAFLRIEIDSDQRDLLRGLKILLEDGYGEIVIRRFLLKTSGLQEESSIYRNEAEKVCFYPCRKRYFRSSNRLFLVPLHYCLQRPDWRWLNIIKANILSVNCSDVIWQSCEYPIYYRCFCNSSI